MDVTKRKEEVWQLFSLIGTVFIQSMIYVVKGLMVLSMSYVIHQFYDSLVA